jgi:glucokinase
MIYDAQGHAALAEAVFASNDFSSLEQIAAQFVSASTSTRPVAAAFGVAGPVHDGTASITNLPWVLDEKQLSKELGIPRVHLENDLVASARGCLEVEADELTVLTPWPPARHGANIGVIAAGTGLGEARLLWCDGRYLVLPTEGGHTDYGPRSSVEADLWHFLSGRFPDHISYERVLSGAGLSAIYEFFVARRGSEAPEVVAKLREGDRNAGIAQLGLAGEDESAEQAVDLFAFIYGAEAGNIALRELALGGVYVTGNIGHTIVPARREKFLQGFVKKGRFASLLASIPIAVVADPFVGLRGALAIAREIGASG